MAVVEKQFEKNKVKKTKQSKKFATFNIFLRWNAEKNLKIFKHFVNLEPYY